ncbi:MAG TPA: methyltransferase domain-containing protein [Syntrophales bacterium]|nr:methyltransferase domain-containing protein [Syntrophales bacterium]
MHRSLIQSWVPFGDNNVIDKIIAELKGNDFNVSDFVINVDEYRNYMQKANYPEFNDYYSCYQSRNNFIEKSLEHYLAAKLLALSRSDVYIDIANSYSPVPEIYEKLYGCKVYRQDLKFPNGVNNNVIGGDAAHMPLEDGFATKMALHCSFEHFERDSDMRFIREASRVLSSDGRLCILPLYLFTVYAIQTDIAVLSEGSIKFENDAIIYAADGWEERHGRFYDIPHLISRIRNNLNDLRLTIHVIKNPGDIDSSCYVKFAAVFEKN